MPWDMPRRRPEPKQGGLTLMQIFVHKSADRAPWWRRERWNHMMSPMSMPHMSPMSPLPHMSHMSYPMMMMGTPESFTSSWYRPTEPHDYIEPHIREYPVVPLSPNTVRVVFRPDLRPDLLPAVGEPNLACVQPLDIGVCRGQQGRQGSFRYYYNQDKRECAVFYHFGCSGNANNFATMQKCVDTCRGTEIEP